MTLLSKVPKETTDAVYRAIHEAAYDAYYEHGPLLERNLSEFAAEVYRRIQPQLEEYVRAGLYERERGA